MQERVYRREAGNGAEMRVTRIKIPTSEDIAQQSIFENGGAFGIDPTNAGFGIPLTIEAASRPPFAHGVRSLVGLYRLADLYPPGTEDGKMLLRAAHELLPEFVRMLNDGNSYQEGIARALQRFSGGGALAADPARQSRRATRPSAWRCRPSPRCMIPQTCRAEFCAPIRTSITAACCCCNSPPPRRWPHS